MGNGILVATKSGLKVDLLYRSPSGAVYPLTAFATGKSSITTLCALPNGDIVTINKKQESAIWKTEQMYKRAQTAAVAREVCFFTGSNPPTHESRKLLSWFINVVSTSKDLPAPVLACAALNGHKGVDLTSVLKDVNLSNKDVQLLCMALKNSSSNAEIRLVLHTPCIDRELTRLSTTAV